MFYNLVVTILLKKKGQKQKRRWYLYEEKTEGKQSSPTMRISVEGIGKVFPGKLIITRGIVSIKILKKRILRKIWWIYLRKITPFIWPLIILFQAVTRLKTIWILRVLTCFQHCSSFAKHFDFASVSVATAMWTYKGDTNLASEEGKNEPSSLTILTDSSFNIDSNEKS